METRAKAMKGKAVRWAVGSSARTTVLVERRGGGVALADDEGPLLATRLSLSRAAAYLPLVAAAHAALELMPPTEPATVLVAGAEGALAPLLVQMISARAIVGDRVIVAGSSAATAPLRRLCALSALDPSDGAFAASLGAAVGPSGADIFFDLIGCEDDPRVVGTLARDYVSLAQPLVRSLATDGLVGGVARALSGEAGDESVPALVDGDRALAWRLVMDGICEGALHIDRDAGEWRDAWTNYLEYLRWPRDVDTGVRIGLPGVGDEMTDPWEICVPPPQRRTPFVAPQRQMRPTRYLEGVIRRVRAP